MIWITWRQFRTQAIVGAAAFGVGAIYLLLLGLSIRSNYDSSVAGCIANGCAPGIVSGFEARYDTVISITDLVLMAVPGLLGVFWGAPLISSELAAGTHRLAWHQSVTRTRWLAVKLLVVGLTSVAITGLLGLLLSWGAGEYDTLKAAKFSTLIFGARGVVPFTYAAFAFALGAAAGLLLRRPVAAMALTLAVFAAAQFTVPTLLRPNYLTPHTANIRLDKTTLSHAEGIILNGSSLTIGGITLPDAWVISTGPALASTGQPPNADKLAECTSPGQHEQTVSCLASLDMHVSATYQPNTRYWPFQFIEAGIYLAATALLAFFSFWWVRRRIA
ncbi:ABC transporter permease subunit [Kitasatospora sp. NPDC004289]